MRVDLRGCTGVVKDVAVFEVLSVGACLEMLFQGFLTLERGEGRLVDKRLGCFARHVVSEVPLFMSVLLLYA